MCNPAFNCFSIYRLPILVSKMGSSPANCVWSTVLIGLLSENAMFLSMCHNCFDNTVSVSKHIVGGRDAICFRSSWRKARKGRRKGRGDKGREDENRGRGQGKEGRGSGGSGGRGRNGGRGGGRGGGGGRGRGGVRFTSMMDKSIIQKKKGGQGIKHTSLTKKNIYKPLLQYVLLSYTHSANLSLKSIETNFKNIYFIVHIIRQALGH